MIFDWNSSKPEALESGMRVHDLCGYTLVTMKPTDGRVENHVFRNFHHLNIEEGAEIVNCVFEDCVNLSFDECKIKNCVFRRVASVELMDSEVFGTRFEKLASDNGEILILTDSTLSGCTFEDVALRDESYLCEGYGDAWVEDCSFKNIRTDRADRELFHCEKTRGKIFKRTKELCIVDEDSCIGLDRVTVLPQAGEEE